MLNTSYLRPLAKRMHKSADRHRDILKVAGDAQHLSKQAIFAMHRQDIKDAAAKLKQAQKLLHGLQKKYAHTDLMAEGGYRAGVEEFVEGTLLHQYVQGKKIGAIEQLTVSDEIYLAGLGDVPGELYRFAVRDVTNGRVDALDTHIQAGSAIVETLVGMNLTKYLRTKTDQAKQALHKLEKIKYEVTLRDGYESTH